ncbi:Mor transcription activator family protein [Pseudomonas sp. dw_358]|uniref:Mor transcription activator family protein n=1 Tax=Pseudomonas sp. dw_358 TaxID=2720083 RepID=UPI001BD65907|nr:Mor transcription activator family protein [Pseudomonas sp. dw_358]
MDVKDLNQIDISQLPASLQTLIECIGLENAYCMTRRYGGRPKYIPKHVRRTSLSQWLPIEALAELIRRYAGTALEIPKADHFERQLRNLQIHRATEQGCSRSVLADRYGLSLRQIGNIRRQAGAV